MTSLSQITSMIQDNLILSISPQVQVGRAVIKQASAEATYARGTVLHLDTATGKYEILAAASKNPAAIVACDVEISTTADTEAVVYLAGKFNVDDLKVGGEYTLSAADKDCLHQHGILLGSFLE